MRGARGDVARTTASAASQATSDLNMPAPHRASATDGTPPHGSRRRDLDVPLRALSLPVTRDLYSVRPRAGLIGLMFRSYTVHGTRSVPPGQHYAFSSGT